VPAEKGGERRAKTLVAAAEQLLQGCKRPSRVSRTCGHTLRLYEVSKALHAKANNQAEACPYIEYPVRAPRRPR